MPLQIVVSNAIGAFQGLVGGGPGPGPGPGPLPSGFAAGYSVRKLSSSYSGSALRVRRTVAPFDEQDIGFDSNGDLDTAAITTFGGSDSLTVSRWYDQSGNLFDVTQGTATAQPTIFDGTAVITVNGKPAVSFDGNDKLLYTGITNTDLVTADGHASSVVFKDTSTSGFKGVIGTDDRAIDFVTRLGNTDWQYSITTNNTPELQYTASASNYNVQNLSFVNKGAVNAYWRLNASQIASNLGGGVVTPGTTNWEVGESVGLKYQGLLQEVVVWNTDNDSNAAGIESNINTYYSIYPTSGLLYDYPGAAAAYSVRSLSNNAIKCMRVRRTVAPFDEQDIGFDSNGDLDTAAIASFGGSDPLTVSAWYDQSGQSRHATQATATSQPSIYDGAAVITENGKAILSGGVLQYSTITYTNSVHSTFYICRFDANAIYASGSGSGTGQYQAVHRGGVIFERIGGLTTYHPTASTATTNAQHLISILDDATTTTSSVDGTSGTVSSAGTWTAGVTLTHRGEYGLSPDVKIQELVIYDSDESTNRTGIESNINGYYGVYTMYNPDAPTSGLLYDYSGAAVAYSVRQLNNNATYAMRVRRTVAPFDEQDIGFDSNGELDTSAISTFGGSDPLTVSRWYDQTGNQNHATQGTAGNQPTIYDGAAVITNNGVSAVQFDNSGQDEFFFTAVTTVKTVFSVCGNDGTGFSALLGTDTSSSTADRSLRQINGAVWYLDNTGPEDWYKEANGDAYIDGSQVTGRPSGGSQQLIFAWNTSPASTYGFSSISNRFNNRGWYGKIQEIVIYENTDYIDSTNRTGIESNINGYYNVYTEYNPDAPTSGFLFDYSGAAVAYSVRQLNNNATVALRVRRTVAPFDEQDIGFDGSGNLDTSAISTFGGSDSLKVSRWYDQTGNQNHATQVNVQQPSIYDGAAVITNNGTPILDFNFSGFEFASQTFSGEFMLVTARTHYGYRYVGGSSVNPPNNGYRDVANNSALALNNSSEVTFSGTNTSAVKLDVLYRNSSNLVSLNVDGTANSSTHTLSGDFVANLIGGGGGNLNSAQQNFHEFILYSNSNNVTGIETNINTYYSIY